MVRACLAFTLLASGCIFGGSNGNTVSGDPGTGSNGFGQPTLEVTVDGVHLGPAAPDPGSSASLIDQQDPSAGAQSQLNVQITSSSAGATCQLSFERFGMDAAPIGFGAYTLGEAQLGGTPDGIVSPIGGERVMGPGDTWSCAGSSCDGSTLEILAIDSTHLEGYFGGTLASENGGAPADIVCAFYVPMAAYQP